MASELKKLESSRTALKGWVTREATELTKLLDKSIDSELSIALLKMKLTEFDKRLKALDEKQAEIEAEILDPVLQAQDIDITCAFRNKSLETKLRVLEKLSELESTKEKAAASVSVGGNANGGKNAGSQSHTRLPKLEIEKFSGDITCWQSFWDQFESIVHKSNIPIVNKFSYLRSLLNGEALETVKGLTLSEANYEIARQCLMDRYAKPQRTIFLHIQSLLQLSTPASAQNVSALWKLRDEINVHVRCLNSLGVTNDQYGIILTPLILSRLPHEIRLEWARHGKDKEKDLDFLLNFLTTEIESRERSEGFRQMPNPAHRSKTSATADEKKPTEQKNATASALAVSATTRISCNFCGRPHPSHRCYDVLNLSVNDRRDKFKSAGVCFRCISKTHRAFSCDAKCKRCSGSHHELLCWSESNSNSNSATKSDKRQKSDGKFEKTQKSHMPASEKASEESSLVATCVVNGQTVLQTAVVTIAGEHENTTATILFDTGSDNTFITSALVRKICPKWVTSRNIGYVAFGGEKTTSNAHNVYKLDVFDKEGREQTLNAIEVQTICAPLHKPRIPPEMLHSALSAHSDINLTDMVKSPHGEVKVDILVGLDQYWDLVKGEVRRLIPKGLVLQNTLFGWMLSGSWCRDVPDTSDSAVGQVLSVHQLVCLCDMPETTLKKFWELEAIGVTGVHEGASSEDSVLVDFNKSVEFVGGRYEVKLPWKPNVAELNLLNDRKIAEKRLDSLTKKLSKDPVLDSRYKHEFQQMESEGIVREVVQADGREKPSRVFYMPHRPVVKESKVTTKVRPVFDASAKGANGVSLNDCLETGPSLIPCLVDILIRFRRWRIGISADITKAFHQIKICEADQDALRFLLNDNGILKTYNFQRVPFGCTSSPFLLNATVKHHLAKYPETRAVSELKDNLYVDDWLSGADYDHEACELFQEGRQVMGEGGFPLAKSNSNSDEVTEMFFREFGAKQTEIESVKILGLRWEKTLDCFKFDGIDVPNDLVTTKRVVLSLLARLFDPLGFLNPYTMYVKVLLQQIWLLDLDWDEEVPQSSNIHDKFLSWLGGLEVVRNWEIPRCLTVLPWSSLESEQMELFCFGDASEKGYGAVVYLRVNKGDDTYDVSLIASRARVAPVKRVSLPRLELLAALLTARLLQVVRLALKLPDISYSCWTDSTITLSWIKGNPCKWKTFVANRVSEIQKLTETSHWSHCPGKGNPADLLSRGVLAEDLVSEKQWLTGPDWMYQSNPSKVNVPVPLEQLEKLLEPDRAAIMVVSEIWVPCDVQQFLNSERSSVQVVTETWVTCEPVLDISRWGSFLKAVRVTAWIMRFCHNVRQPQQRISGDLSLEEISTAKVRLFQHVQGVSFGQELEACRKGKQVARSSPLAKLDPFIGKDDLLRIKGRLQLSSLSYGEKHPVILPKGNIAELLIRDKHKFLKHAGVETMMTALRDEYWILGLRNQAKAVKRDCAPCQRIDTKACNEFVAPLPELRIHQAPPFTISGLDYAGPLFCVDIPGQKYYILLFTCALIRAIHLELTGSLSEVYCMLALRRFSARRGLPTILYSDNAKTFQATEKELLKFFGLHAPKWKYIAPRSPWWGGWWERLVRSVKSALRKSLGGSCLTKSELETSLCEVEACINSRPITFVGDDVAGRSPLTPSQFLIGRNAGFQSRIAETERVVSQQDLSERELIRQRRLEIFWELWNKDYIRNLPPSIQKFKRVGGVGIGSLVLIREDNVPRMQWPLGVVQKLLPSKDEAIRSVEIKTSKGVLVRAVQRLHDLEIGTQDGRRVDSVVTPKNVPQEVVKPDEIVTRCGRRVRPRQKLDL